MSGRTVPSPQLPPASERHSNSDLFLWALSLTGGSDGYVDVEDVYLKCFELAPKRFGWRTRPEIPDLQKISVARRDVIRKQTAAGIEAISAQEVDVSQGRRVPAYKWRLTNVGNEWIDRWQRHLEKLYGGGTVPAPRQRHDPARVREVRNSAPFSAWRSSGQIDSEIWELADLLECSPSSEVQVWSLRLDRLESIGRAEGDDDLCDFAVAIRSWIKGRKELQ